MSARHIHFSLFGPAQREAAPVLDRPRTADADTMRIGRTTWVGMTLAVVGWAMLLGEMGVQDFLTVQDPRLVSPTFHDDFVDVAKTLIFSGFGLALVGALQTGFGALNRFFEAVLVRSGQKAQAQALPSSVEPYRDTYEKDDGYKRDEGYRQAETYKRDDTYKREEAYKREEPAPASAGRYTRPYKTFADGSVEVETILGSRRFRTMAEARDFI